MKRIILMLVALLAMTISTQAQQKTKRFTIECSEGVSALYNYSALSKVNYSYNTYKSSITQTFLGLALEKGGLYFDIGMVGNDLKYEKLLNESFTLCNIGFSASNIKKITDNFNLDFRIGMGLLLSDSKVYFSNKEYDIDTKIGSYINFQLIPLFYIKKYLAFGCKFETFFGSIKGKDYPTEINTYLIDSRFKSLCGANASIMMKVAF